MDAASALNFVLVVGVIVAGFGYAIGQFVSARRKGAADALAVALNEIEALRVKADRQENDLAVVRRDLTAVKAENQTLRSLLSGGTFLAEQIRTLLAEEIERGAHLTANLLRDGAA